MHFFTAEQGRIQTCGGPWAGFRHVEAPGQGSDMWRPLGRVQTCGGPWAAFSNGAVDALPTLEYPKNKR